ncbi:MAG: hypothetical protein H6819_10960 [Phycisphaerales bacterium]|nr:hypothetical protein [Phycisphaerales bacterium]MCB9855595.1 hypothetical protein [Phycisphaerales bacterium]MCB9864916.1 hypothetical protein [Phycisphaerales bacterium]
MNKEVIHSLMSATTLRDALDILADDSVFFSVDQDDYDEDIVLSCEARLKTGRLSAYWADGDGDAPGGTHIRYGDKVVRCPHMDAPIDRHITIRTLNKILAPDYEIRLCIDSDDVDNLTFLPLSTADWKILEQEYGPQLKRRFYAIQETPRLFVDDLNSIKPPELASRHLDAAAKKRLRTLVKNQKEGKARESALTESKTLGTDPGPPPRRPKFSQWSNIAPVRTQVAIVFGPIGIIGGIVWGVASPEDWKESLTFIAIAAIVSVIAGAWLFRYRTLARTGLAVVGQIAFVAKSDNRAFALSPRVGYAYEVNGKQRKCEVQIPQKPKGGIAAGMNVWVIYDPMKPERSAMWGLFDKK